MPTTLTLKFGSSGPAVLALQNALIANGALAATAADGSTNNDQKFGYITQEAVKKFQQQNPPLNVDGIVGQATRTALGLINPNVVEAQNAQYIFNSNQRRRLAELLDGLVGTGLLDLVDDALFLWAVKKIDEVLAANLPQPIVNMLHDINQGIPDPKAIGTKLAKLLNQKINIPFFGEETEQKIFEYIVDLLIHALGWGGSLEEKLGN